MDLKLFVFQGFQVSHPIPPSTTSLVHLGADQDLAAASARKIMPGVHLLLKGSIPFSEILTQAQQAGYVLPGKEIEVKVESACDKLHFSPPEPIRDLEAMAAYMRDHGYTVAKMGADI